MMLSLSRVRACSSQKEKRTIKLRRKHTSTRSILPKLNLLSGSGRMIDERKAKRIRLVWAILLLVGFPWQLRSRSLTHSFSSTFRSRPRFLSNLPGLLSTASILFGFTSLIIVSKEWVEREIWAVLVPPLALIILSGVSISNLALGLQNPVQALLLSSATFNANVVSTGLVVGYVIQRLSQQQKLSKALANMRVYLIISAFAVFSPTRVIFIFT
jgi:hypothetical protein